MPDDENQSIRIVQRAVSFFVRDKRARTVWVGIVMLVLGVIVGPFVDGLLHRLGEHSADIFIGRAEPVNLAPSTVAKAVYRISIINKTSDMADAEVERVAGALQRQVHEHFAPIWGVDAEISVVKRGEAPAPGAWWVELHDHHPPDVVGALGYHSVTPDGLPNAMVFTKDADSKTDPTVDKNLTWTVVTSHEILNMLVDPRANLTAVNFGVPRVYTLEVASPTADVYKIDTVAVSNFVFPAWFEAQRPADSTQFDYLRLMHRPLEVRPGGLALTLKLGASSDWQMLTQ